jgi:hypothetical protein
MKHDIQAAWASSEIADIIMNKQCAFFGSLGTLNGWSVYAGSESNREWPIADGVISADNASHQSIKIALEYKRPNEGLHGILTALGQSLAYLEKGYDASVVVIPKSYASHPDPGEHIKNIIDSTVENPPISIYTYDSPNTSAIRPFKDRLHCVREIELPNCRTISSARTAASASSFSTLWAHVREGMSHPDAFFRYCQAAKMVSTSFNESIDNSIFPQELIDAVERIDPNNDAANYLSNTAGDSLSDKAWRYTWFNYYFWKDLIPLYSTSTPMYAVNDKPTKIVMMDNKKAKLFSGRSDSIKTILVRELNSGALRSADAWEQYAKNVRKDAHSYREVIDSGLFHIGFLQADGRLTDLGYKYVDACERINGANSGIPLEILRSAILQNGRYDAFLHYVYQVSEARFSQDPFAFTKISRGRQVFDKNTYLNWLYEVLNNQLHLIKTSTARAGSTRKPFQAELPLLKKMGFVKGTSKGTSYRIGVGLEIDWPQVQSSMIFAQSL